MGPAIVDGAWLIDHTDDPNLVIADVRWYLDGRDGRAAFEQAHIPGAVWIDLDAWVAAPASPEAGRHPMPTPEVFAYGAGSIGIGDDTTVVAYDDLGGLVAGRLVWMLRILGRRAHLLDGGLQAWPEAPVSGTDSPSARTFTAQPWPSSALADIDEVADATRAGTRVIDSRAPERYRGDTEPVDPRAGHIPGAINLPFPENLVDGRFRSPEELRTRFTDAGIDGSSIFYCGSGVSACHNILAAEAAGLDRPRLYPGSWSQWSSDPERPAATS
ncbi:MAG: sulfurtransferase [Actinomycetia bacterium]|nr:sulfurtransferase [Actinomycetes bacterium]MCP3909482.1 sulfurtransferase [Actinomycetes bacterium]MCP4085976.1 sulfurtransferase [Actinomycetes bacterium]